MRCEQRHALAGAIALLLVVFIAGCGQQSTPAPPDTHIAVQLSSAALQVLQDGTPASVTIHITRPAGTSSPVTLTTAGVPPGMHVAVTSPGSASDASIAFHALSGSVPAAGTYNVAINASDGVDSGSANLALTVTIVAAIQTSVAASAAFLSTSFQPADWSYQFFLQTQAARIKLLSNLQPQHIRLQAVDGAVPMKSATPGPSQWDFSELDDVVQPVLSAADHSPEFQIAVAPAFMYDSTGAVPESNFQTFADFCANLVRYYNTSAGFTDAAGIQHKSASGIPITWWGIFNEPNINHMPVAAYVKLYNLVVPAMQAVDPSLKFVAVELADFGNEPQNFLPTFIAGATAQVDAIATHYYSTCNQRDTDDPVFGSVPQVFVPHMQYIVSAIQASPALAGRPVWVTENNVNADYDKGGGISACNGTTFVIDRRGSSAFFAAWRPYVYAQLTRAGAASLYHWDFDADVQFGEVDYGSGSTYLSYWVDYWLARAFPANSQMLNVSATQTDDVEIMAARRPDASLVVIVADHAVANPADNNGTGAPRTVSVDLSALGAFSSASMLVLDAHTDPSQGPAAVAIAAAPQISVSLSGYSAAMVTLTR